MVKWNHKILSNNLFWEVNCFTFYLYIFDGPNLQFRRIYSRKLTSLDRPFKGKKVANMLFASKGKAWQQKDHQSILCSDGGLIGCEGKKTRVTYRHTHSWQEPLSVYWSIHRGQLLQRKLQNEITPNLYAVGCSRNSCLGKVALWLPLSGCFSSVTASRATQACNCLACAMRSRLDHAWHGDIIQMWKTD